MLIVLQEPTPSPQDFDVNAGNTRIPARSRRQAMDWGLALASQGVEATIGRDAAGWLVQVSAQDGQKAIKTLRQYHLENRGWPWRPKWVAQRVMFDWRCLGWAGALALCYWVSVAHPGVKHDGIMDSDAVQSGQWWRIFTAMALHQDLGHLASNLTIGIVLMGLAMGRFGTWPALLAAFLAGAAGNVVSLLINEKPFEGLGASGMVMGALGLLSARTIRHMERVGTPLKQQLAGVAAGVMLFVLYALAPGSDLPAHLGGFVAGLLLGTALIFSPTGWPRARATNVISGVVLLILLSLAWGLALTN